MKERRGSDCNWSTSRIAGQVSLLVLSTKEDPCFFWCQWKAVCVRAQSCPTLCNPMDCSPPGSSVHGILQARILEWVVISFSRGSFQPRDWIYISRTNRQILYHWATREAPWILFLPVFSWVTPGMLSELPSLSFIICKVGNNNTSGRHRSCHPAKS